MALGVLSVFGFCDSQKHPVLRGTVNGVIQKNRDYKVRVYGVVQ